MVALAPSWKSARRERDTGGPAQRETVPFERLHVVPVHCRNKAAKGFWESVQSKTDGARKSSEDVRLTARPDNDNVNGTKGHETIVGKPC
jgi:hypothetical protein